MPFDWSVIETAPPSQLAPQQPRGFDWDAALGNDVLSPIESTPEPPIPEVFSREPAPGNPGSEQPLSQWLSRNLTGAGNTLIDTANFGAEMTGFKPEFNYQPANPLEPAQQELISPMPLPEDNLSGPARVSADILGGVEGAILPFGAATKAVSGLKAVPYLRRLVPSLGFMGGGTFSSEHGRTLPGMAENALFGLAGPAASAIASKLPNPMGMTERALAGGLFGGMTAGAEALQDQPIDPTATGINALLAAIFHSTHRPEQKAEVIQNDRRSKPEAGAAATTAAEAQAPPGVAPPAAPERQVIPVEEEKGQGLQVLTPTEPAPELPQIVSHETLPEAVEPPAPQAQAETPAAAEPSSGEPPPLFQEGEPNAVETRQQPEGYQPEYTHGDESGKETIPSGRNRNVEGGQEPTEEIRPPDVGEKPNTSDFGGQPTIDPTDLPLERIRPTDIGLDPKRFQFKQDTNELGEQAPIKGKWDYLKAGIVHLWEDLQGNLWAANGHHRVAKAQREGVPYLNAQILREADGISASDARRIAAEINIAGGRGTIFDHAEYFRLSGGYDDAAAAKEKGIVGDGYSIGKFATDNLYDQFRNRAIDPKRTAAIAEGAPNNDKAQTAAIDYFQTHEKESADSLRGYAYTAAHFDELGIKDIGGVQGELPGMAGLSESYARVNEIKNDKVKQITSLINVAKSGASLERRSELAAEAGLTVKTKGKQETKAFIAELERQREMWENYHLHPEIKQQIVDIATGQQALKPGELFEHQQPAPIPTQSEDIFGGDLEHPTHAQPPTQQTVPAPERPPAREGTGAGNGPEAPAVPEESPAKRVRKAKQTKAGTASDIQPEARLHGPEQPEPGAAELRGVAAGGKPEATQPRVEPARPEPAAELPISAAPEPPPREPSGPGRPSAEEPPETSTMRERGPEPMAARAKPEMEPPPRKDTPEIRKLTEAFQELKGVKPQVQKAYSIGERISKAKDDATKGIDGLRGAGHWMKEKLIGRPYFDEPQRAFGWHHGALSESGLNNRKFVRKGERSIPKLKDREAISNYLDTGGDPEKLDQAISETRRRYRAGYERAKSLPPDLVKTAEHAREYFEARLDEAIDAGILEDGIEDYIHRMYKKDSSWKRGAVAEIRGGIFTGKPTLAKKRVFGYDFEAERAGHNPEKDFLKRIAAYDMSLNKSIADRNLVKNLMLWEMPDGKRAIDAAGYGTKIEGEGNRPGALLIKPNFKADSDYVHYDHPALRKWKWAYTDPTTGETTLMQGDVLVHKDALKRINAVFGKSQIREYRAGRFALGLGREVKQTRLSLSLFHPVQIGIHAAEHRTFRMAKEIDLSDPIQRGLVEHELVVYDYRGHELFDEGISGSGLLRFVPGLGKRLHAFNEMLFQDFIPRYKMSMALHALKRNRARYPELSEDELMQMTARQANSAFGELNYGMMARNKTMQDVLRIGLLAPDFLEARARFKKQAFTKYGGEQRTAFLIGAATMYVAARILNKIIDDNYHWEPENWFDVEHNGRRVGIRTVQGDLIHFFTDPAGFFYHRLNPVYGRTLIEALTHRDSSGQKVTGAEQLRDFALQNIPISLEGIVNPKEKELLDGFLNAIGITYRKTKEQFEKERKQKAKASAHNRAVRKRLGLTP